MSRPRSVRHSQIGRVCFLDAIRVLLLGFVVYGCSESTVVGDACTPSEVGARSDPQAAEHCPIVFVLRCPSPGAMRGRDNRSIGSYLELAIWEDGKTVYAANPDGHGPTLFVGEMDSRRVTEILAELDEAGFFREKPGGYLHVNFPHLEIAAREGTRTNRLFWDEMEIRGIDYAPPGPDVMSFVKVWKSAREILQTGPLANAKPLLESVPPGTNFRGIGPETGYDWYLDPIWPKKITR